MDCSGTTGSRPSGTAEIDLADAEDAGERRTDRLAVEVAESSPTELQPACFGRHPT